MSSPPPTKPPRGVKQGKETSGLLMSVIRTLSASETNEQREKERAKLEKEYKKSDARLDELVAEHAQEIMEVMQKFTAVSQSLASWTQHCDAATARLAACRGLLRLRRDDLKRLWMTARTHHYALQMLTDIEKVVVSERQARELISAGRVVGAAHTLSNALSAAPSHVTALTATTVQLQIMKESLVEKVVRNMSDAVYRGERTPRALSSRRRAALLLAELTKSEEITDTYLQDITPEFEASLTEEDKTFDTTIMISLEALGVLEQLQAATEKFKVKIQNELLEVIDIVSRRVIEEGDVSGAESEQDGEIPDAEGASETGRPLARLVAILADEFRACAARNKRLLQLWRAALQKYKLSDTCLHTEQHYWSAVQQVMQLLVTEYLDIESVQVLGMRSVGTGANFADQLKLADYFGKKRPMRRRTQLFKLTSGCAVRVAAGRAARSARVVRAAPALLPRLLPALHDLCSHIETLTFVSECSLRAFVTDYIRTGESERLAREARNGVEAALRGSDAWRETSAPPPVPGFRHRCVFSCCVCAWQAIAAAARAGAACGALAGLHALRGALAGAAALAAGAQAAHARRAAQGTRAGKWLADDDIVRFLQALPNWKAAITAADKPSQQELQQAYEREAEILGSSLGDGAIGRNEIIASTDTLIDLAIHCESMDWIAMNIRNIPSMVSGVGPGGGIKLNDKFLNDINSAAVIFDDLSHKCLLLLHLEIRIQCFHYLGQWEGGAGGAGAAGATQLAAALLAFHERAAAVLAPHRERYILEGVGEMMSWGVVWGWGAGGAGGADGAGGAARLAALRHALAALRLDHAGLRHADLYLRLLDAHPQDIITSVREKGAQFSELEYLNAFKIIGAKRGISQSDMKQYLKQLSTALGHVGVTV